MSLWVEFRRTAIPSCFVSKALGAGEIGDGQMMKIVNSVRVGTPGGRTGLRESDRGVCFFFGRFRRTQSSFIGAAFGH
jgi:hypothetical protein